MDTRKTRTWAEVSLGALRHNVEEMQRALDEKKIPAWTDIWGADVTHDWSWWRLQIAYFMKRVLDV